MGTLWEVPKERCLAGSAPGTGTLLCKNTEEAPGAISMETFSLLRPSFFPKHHQGNNGLLLPGNQTRALKCFILKTERPKKETIIIFLKAF